MIPQAIWRLIEPTVTSEMEALIQEIKKEVHDDPALNRYKGQIPIPSVLRALTADLAEQWLERVYGICQDAYSQPSMYGIRGKKRGSDDLEAPAFNCAASWAIEQFIGQHIHGLLLLAISSTGPALGSIRKPHRDQADFCRRLKGALLSKWHTRLSTGPGSQSARLPATGYAPISGDAKERLLLGSASIVGAPETGVARGREIGRNSGPLPPNGEGRRARSSDTGKLPPKQQDLSNYLDAAQLTNRQRECASLKWEYGINVSQIAARLRIHRTVVDDHLAAVKKKMDQNRSTEKRAKNKAKSGVI